MGALNFDATNIDPAAPRDIVPPGKYVAQIINSEMRTTKSGTGQFLWLELDILEGEHQGRHLFTNINLVNTNEKAVEIGQRQLSAICHAAGRLQLTDSEQLHGQPMTVTVKVKPGEGNYGPQNEISGFEAVNGAAPVARPAFGQRAAAAAAAAPKVATAAAKPASAPWKRAG